MFQRRDNLARHAASHSENKNNCDVCGKSFARKDALTRHKRHVLSIVFRVFLLIFPIALRIHTRKAQSRNTKDGHPLTQDQLNTSPDQPWTLKCDQMIFQIDMRKGIETI